MTDILRTTEDEIIEHMHEHAPMHERECRDLQEIKGFFIDFLEQIRSNPVLSWMYNNNFLTMAIMRILS